MSKDPAARFSSVAAFAAQLRVAATAAPGRMPPPLAPLPAGATPAPALLALMLQRVGLDGPLLAETGASTPTASVNMGAAGIAYGLYRIACIQDNPALLALADRWITRATRDLGRSEAFYNADLGLTPEIIGPCSLYHTASGVYCVQALIGQALGDRTRYEQAVTAFTDAAHTPSPKLDLTLGRAGILLGTGLVLEALPEGANTAAQQLHATGDRLLAEIWATLEPYAPIATGTDLAVLGMAHGWAGLLYATLCWCQATGAAPTAPLIGRLQELAGCGQPHRGGRRWPRQLPAAGASSRAEYAPGWCNGSAGFAQLWMLADRLLPHSGYDRLAAQAVQTAWDDPDTVGDLCCGLAGRAYALLAWYKYSGDLTWLERADDCAQRTARRIQGWTVRPDSLYKGAMGVAVLAADLARPAGASFPLFEAEG